MRFVNKMNASKSTRKTILKHKKNLITWLIIRSDFQNYTCKQWNAFLKAAGLKCWKISVSETFFVSTMKHTPLTCGNNNLNWSNKIIPITYLDAFVT